MKKFILSLIVGFILNVLSATTYATDVRALTQLFQKNHDHFYAYAQCGGNIARFVEAAKAQRIDLSNSYVLNVAGAGFLETSGFFTRGKQNNWKMLGYFHVVFVADGYVFDFDLDQPLVLKLEDYIRLQFTPPYEPFKVGGNIHFKSTDLKFWTATGYETQSYNLHSDPVQIWKTKLTDLVPYELIMSRPRLK